MASFLCPAVVRCASAKRLAICVRSSFEGVSSGISMEGPDILDVVDARPLSVCEDDLADTAAEVRDDLPETRPGIVATSPFLCLLYGIREIVVVVDSCRRKVFSRTAHSTATV